MLSVELGPFVGTTCLCLFSPCRPSVALSLAAPSLAPLPVPRLVSPATVHTDLPTPPRPPASMTLFADDAPHLAGTVVTLVVFCCLTFAMRVYCRVSRHSWGVEDWLMTAAMVRLPLGNKLSRRQLSL